ncbi:MAG: hypothetical protein HY056_13775 [Proteobacteria bacterium]|nr:hypothetical protein [Pseudomonadota bacterium]
MTRRIRPVLAAIALAMLIGTANAPAQDAPAATGDTAKGKAFVDAKGMTLYTYDRDTAGRSRCSGQCADLWPPFEAPPGAKPAGDWTIVARGDGVRQWAHKGKPLYLWKDDKKPGDVTGDGVNNVWRLAKP